jgi:hypothetical protein
MRALALGLALALGPGGAGAHGYTEFAPLDPVLRGALIAALAETLPPSRPEPSHGDAGGPVAALLDGLDDSTLAALADALRARAGVEDSARLPDSVILPLFYDLDGFLSHETAHGHEGDAAAADLRRLRALLEASR